MNDFSAALATSIVDSLKKAGVDVRFNEILDDINISEISFNTVDAVKEYTNMFLKFYNIVEI